GAVRSPSDRRVEPSDELDVRISRRPGSMRPMTTPPIGRRAQNRATRHAQLMAAATEIIATKGLSGLTMQAVAELVDCAVGTIYTYFPSKTALLSELQIAAIRTLQATFDASLASWDDELARLDI